jgi:hypothetical protein
MAKHKGKKDTNLIGVRRDDQNLTKRSLQVAGSLHTAIYALRTLPENLQRA